MSLVKVCKLVHNTLCLNNRAYILGQPVAWCITNYETTEVMTMFLESLKRRSPSSMVRVLMTDDGKHCNYLLSIYMLSSYIDDVYCSAARKVFGDIYYAGGMLRSEYTHTSRMKFQKFKCFFFYHKGMETANSQHKS